MHPSRLPHPAPLFSLARGLLIFAGLAGALRATPPLPLTPADTDSSLVLHFSDGSPPAVGLAAVNARLRAVGVRVSQVDIPDSARPLLRPSQTRALTAAEAAAVLDHFPLSRGALLREIALAGREPTMPRGGYLQTSETGVAPYPKVYDMRALDAPTVVFLQHKFGQLHVNSSEAGVGIDEVMTIVSGGPYTWFFVLPGDVVGLLRLGRVSDAGPAWRLSYPGLVPHGGYFDAADGLVVAHAHGPAHFVMRYEDDSVTGAATLGGNPWIDFTSAAPLLRQPRPATR